MKKVIVSAPAKIHLSGEHAVVYGNPAVLASTSNRLYVSLSSDVLAKSVPVLMLRKNDVYINRIIKVFETHYDIRIKDALHIAIVSDIPIGAGMGSSAALAAALIGGLMQFYQKGWNIQKINDLAYQAEGFVHKNSSGSDPAVVTHGGLLWYRKELDFLKMFWLLSYKIPKTFSSIVLIHTKRTESTGDMVALVAKKNTAKPKEFIQTLWEFQHVTKDMVSAIHDENVLLFTDAIRKNEMLLEKLGVVSVSVRKLIREIEKAGGAAKISGAGGVKSGSGTILAVHKNPKVLQSIAKKYKFPFSQVALSALGVRIEQVVA